MPRLDVPRVVAALMVACLGLVGTVLAPGAQADVTSAVCRCLAAEGVAQSPSPSGPPSSAAEVRRLAARADVVFAGVVDRIRRTPDGVTYSVVVERAYKGAPAADTTVRSPTASASCPLTDLRRGDSYLFFGTVQGSEVEANACGGTALVTEPLTRLVTAELGEGRVPAGDGDDPAGATAELTRVDDSPPPSLTRLAAPGAALALLGLLGLVLTRRLGRP